MKHDRLIASLLLLVIATGAVTGCTTVAKEAVGIARGARGVYAPIRPLAASKEIRPLGTYRRFELGQFTDDFGGKVPPDLMTHFRSAFRKELADKKLPDDPRGKTLLIRGTFLHYEDAGTLGIAIGPLEQVVARVELVDKDSGKVLGVANCIGRTTNRVNLGVAKKGEGLAKAVVSWLKSRYPEESG